MLSSFFLSLFPSPSLNNDIYYHCYFSVTFDRTNRFWFIVIIAILFMYVCCVCDGIINNIESQHDDFETDAFGWSESGKNSRQVCGGSPDTFLGGYCKFSDTIVRIGLTLGLACASCLFLAVCS